MNQDANRKKFYQYAQWLENNANKMSQLELDENEAKFKRGVSMMRQIYLQSGEEFQAPEMKKFNQAKEMVSTIRWIDPKIKGYSKIGLWFGDNYKTKDGIFVFNLEWINDLIEDLDTEDARFKLKLYMDFDCEPID